MKLPTVPTLAAIALAIVSATPHHTSYTLHRRLVDPSRPNPRFEPYGTVETDVDVTSYALAVQLGSGAVVPPKGKFVKAPGREGAGELVDLETAWVHVAVEVAGRDEEEWPTSAVRAVSQGSRMVGGYETWTVRPSSGRC